MEIAKSVTLRPLGLKMTIERVLETEVMDTEEEAIEYNAMEFIEVNTAFSQNLRSHLDYPHKEHTMRPIHFTVL